MTPEAQRVAIAEACGIDVKICPVHRSRTCCGRGYPNYLNDLNAMYEAEKVIPHLRQQYLDNLVVICGIRKSKDCNCAVFATASQRAEAFLRCLGKWPD